MPWNPNSPAGADAANTIDNALSTNQNALDAWASAITDGITVGASTVIQAFRAANTTMLKFRSAAADSANRFQVDLNGKADWGPGNAAVDVTLDRSATATLRANVASGGNLQFTIAGAQVALWAATRTRFMQSMARVRKTSNQTISNNADTVITWETEDFDTDTLHDNVTNNSRLTAAVAGKYKITAVLTTNATVTVLTKLRLNGATTIANTTLSAGANSTGMAETLYALAATDYVEVVAQGVNSSTTALSGVGESHFEMVYVGE